MLELHSPSAFSAGGFRFDLLDEGRFRLDGGAMFRVIPRVLWSRRCPPDEQNRIELAMRPLLVRTPAGKTILIDCGAAPERRAAKLVEQCALEAGRGVEAGLRELGLGPEDVDAVVLTHLHFDHCGGLVRRDAEGREELRFPRAQVFVQQDELEDSAEDCRLCRASYRGEDLELPRERGRIEALAGDAEPYPGLHLEVTGGHTRAHQLVRVRAGEETVVFWGDLIPTSAHIEPHYVMALDLYPRDCWAAKERLLPQAVAEGWVQVFYHDPLTPLGRVVRGAAGYGLAPLA